MAETIDDLLSERPLTIREHSIRNWIAAILLSVSCTVPPAIIQTYPNLFSGVATGTLPAALAGGWPFDVRMPLGNIPPLGWFVFPLLLAWWSIARERSTDGKLASTEKIYLEHLNHEAQTAKATMLKQNLTLEEADQIYDVIRSLGFKRYTARLMFAVRRNAIVTASMIPWIVAVLGIIPALALIVSSYARIEWDAVLPGFVVAFATAARKVWRCFRFVEWNAAWYLSRLPQV